MQAAILVFNRRKLVTVMRPKRSSFFAIFALCLSLSPLKALPSLFRNVE